MSMRPRLAGKVTGLDESLEPVVTPALGLTQNSLLPGSVYSEPTGQKPRAS